ncbi:hypothetical protein P7C70_g1538, partial [Phenoliferia sp. Uapishka_3]
MYYLWGALATTLAFNVPLAAALSSADINSVLGSGSDLTGLSTTLPAFTLSVFTNTTHALFSVNATTTAPDKVGWFGVGPGQGMVDADLIVMWPTFTGSPATDPATSWVLSHRNAPGHVMPTVASADASLATSNFYTLLPALSTTDPSSAFTAVSFVRLLEMPSNYPSTSPHKSITQTSTSVCYASSSDRPPTTTQDATITQHNQGHAAIMMDLSTKANLVPGVSPVASSGGDDGGGPAEKPSWSSEAWPDIKGLPQSKLALTRRDKFLAAHAAIASIALLFFSPLAILTARYFRHLPWFRIHASIQFLSYMLVFVAFVIAANNVQGGQHFKNNHTILGFIIFIAMTIQLALGATAHRAPQYKNSAKPKLASDPTVFESVTGKPMIRLGHIAFGLFITIVGWAQIRLGLEIWVEYSDSGRQVPLAVLIIFWALVGLESAEVFLGRFLKEEVQHDAKASSVAGTGFAGTGTGQAPSGMGGASETTPSMVSHPSVMGRAMGIFKGKRPGLAGRSSDDVTIVGEDEAGGKGKANAEKREEADMARARTV